MIEKNKHINLKVHCLYTVHTVLWYYAKDTHCLYSTVRYYGITLRVHTACIVQYGTMVLL